MRKLKFLWSVKKIGDVGWGVEYLKGGSGCEIFCTGNDQSSPKRKGNGHEDAEIELQERAKLMDDDNPNDGNDNEDDDKIGVSLPPTITLHNKRPNFRQIVQETFSPNSNEESSPAAPPQKVAILICGPSGMGAALRREIWPWVKGGREVWWHSEEFGW